MSPRRRRPARRLYRLRVARQPAQPVESQDETLAEAQRLVDALRREVDELADVVARFRRFVDIPPQFLRAETPPSEQPAETPESSRRPERPG